jgi:hypothetical protein
MTLNDIFVDNKIQLATLQFHYRCKGQKQLSD